MVRTVGVGVGRSGEIFFIEVALVTRIKSYIDWSFLNPTRQTSLRHFGRVWDFLAFLFSFCLDDVRTKLLRRTSDGKLGDSSREPFPIYSRTKKRVFICFSLLLLLSIMILSKPCVLLLLLFICPTGLFDGCTYHIIPEFAIVSPC